MVLLVMKVLLAPLLLAACSYATWRWGATVGGWLLGLPLISGPVSLFLFVERGPVFAESAARGTLLGLLATGVFCTLYALLARRARWWITLPLAYAACLAVAWGMTFIDLPVIWVAALVLGVLAVLAAASRRPGTCGPVCKTSRASLVVKMLVASVAVVAITTSAGALGPRLAGLLAPMPVVLALMTACSHRRDGHEAVRGLLRGALAGSWGGAAFFAVVALSLEIVSPATAYSAAVLAGLGAAALAIRIQARTPSAIAMRSSIRRSGDDMWRERHLQHVPVPRLRTPRPAFLWIG